MFRRNLFILFILTEGGLILSYEITSSRWLQPVFGSSIWVWTFILGITMTGLALGYHLGSKLAYVSNFTMCLCLNSSLAASLIPFSGSVFYLAEPWLYNIPFFLSLLLCSVFLLLPPMALLGSLSPLAIEYVHTFSKNSAGRTSGNIFFISTLGGVVYLFLFAWLVLPFLGSFHGISLLCIIFLTVSFALFRNKKIFLYNLILLLTGIIIHYFYSNHLKGKIIYRTENASSSLEVVEADSHQYQLYVNGILQSEMGIIKRLNYMDTILKGIKKKIPCRKTLVIGLGGGHLAMECARISDMVTAVEFNKSVLDIAGKFHRFPKNITLVCEDGRTFINKNCHSEKYDNIILDVFHGEVPPFYLFTLECLGKIKPMLRSDSSRLWINWHGYIKGKEGKGTRILIHTLHKVEFDVILHPTGLAEDFRNLVLECRPDETRSEKCSQSEISTDEFAKGEYWDALAQIRWRMNYYAWKKLR